MAAAFFITLREGLEAAVIVSIVLTYLRQIGRQDAFRQVWIGLGAAIGVGTLVGTLAYVLIGGLEGSLRLLVFAAVSLSAVAVLTWMLVWMRKQERSLSRHLQEQVDEALASGSLWGSPPSSSWLRCAKAWRQSCFSLPCCLAPPHLTWPSAESSACWGQSPSAT